MRSSLRARRLPAASARYGQVRVARRFADPERGLVECAAARLLAVTPDRMLEPDEVAQPCQPGEGHGVMFTVSWLDRGGEVAGFALIAHRDDAAGVAAAEREAARWRAVVRSRRLLVAATGGLCLGGHRAARTIEEAAGTGGAPVFVLGHPVADPGTLRRLQREGVRVAQDLDEVPDGAVVAFPAHGAGLGEQAEAAARGLAVIDGTCPLVASAQADALRYAERGDVVVVVGRTGHAALPALAGHAGPAVVVAGSPAEAGSVPLPAGRGVSFVVDPAMPADEAMQIMTTLRARVPDLRGHHFDVLCEVASDWVQTVAAVTAGSDLVLALAAEAGSGEVDAVRAACRPGVPVRAVTSLADLDAETLRQATVIGLVTGLSAPADLQPQVTSALAGLGPLSVRHRGTRTQPGPRHDWSQGGGPRQEISRSGVSGVGAQP
jgi:4-hydroxy-3-methylbut-2-enyl diphosphate reductase